MSNRKKVNIIISKGGIIMNENDSAPINCDECHHDQGFSKEVLKEAGVTTGYLPKETPPIDHPMHRRLHFLMFLILIFFFLIVVLIGGSRLSLTGEEKSNTELVEIPIILGDV